MYKRKILVPILASGFLFAGCANQPTQEQAGMVIGGVLGGVLGSQVGSGHGTTAAIIAGTLIGGGIGGAVGRSMDETDRLKTAQTLETVRTGVPSSWRNPDTGSGYSVTPTRTYDEASGPCREYTVNAIIDGREEQVSGTACRQSDGGWKVR